MIHKKPQKKDEIIQDASYWISFSDIMSGLLIIFILACLALLLELIQTKAKVDSAISEVAKAESLKRVILQEVKESLEKQLIYVEISDNESILRIPESLLTFETNQFEIPANQIMQKSLKKIGEVLYSSLAKENRTKLMDTIFVEGHTDRRPSNRFFGNWGLSTFRAISVWNYWNHPNDNQFPLWQLKNHQGKPLFSVSGYGKTRPLVISEKTRIDLKKDRRIDIRFTVKKPAIKDYKTILEVF